MINQTVITALRRYFTPAEVARLLRLLPKLQTPIMDLVYPESQRNSSMLPLSEIKDITGAVPVVRKGTRSQPIDGGDNTTLLIDPEAFNPSLTISAAELNNLIAMGIEAGVESFSSEKIEILRGICRKGTEIMAAQSLSGKIDYPMTTESGALKSYKVDYGAIDTMDAVDITNMSYGDIRKVLEEMYVEQQGSGFAADIRFLTSSAAYTKILNVITDLKTFPGQFVADGLVLEGKYKIVPMTVTYKKPGSAAATPVIPDKYIQTIDVGAPHTLFYLAIDDFEAGLAPMPFFAKVKVMDDPSAIKIIGNSKPLPAPVLAAMRKRKVVA